MLVVSAFLLFTHLGHYALWDDEAGLVLTARGVWQTGDTSIIAGHNIVVPRSGILDRNLKDRANPPLPAWLLAPFAAISGTDSFWVRLPLAFCGLACVALIAWWLWRDRADRVNWWLMILTLVGNVSFFLYFRQARYYGITLLCSVAIAYLYFHWNGSKRRILGIALLLAVLVATHYMTLVGLGVTMLVDYIFWQRHHRPLCRLDWVVLLGPRSFAERLFFPSGILFCFRNSPSRPRPTAFSTTLFYFIGIFVT